jgi:DNA invertase Pin-like site-specific DNA recombinase
MSKTVGYLRVSSRAQDAASQRSAIERAAAARGESIDEWYSEKKSGRTLEREELQRLRADVRAGRVKRLWIFKLDRLARSGIRDVFEVIEELREAKCELATVADGFALDGPAAEIVLAVLAWSAKMERLAINERIAAARERLEAEGRPWGRPSRVTAAERERALAMRAAGRSVRSISMALKVPRSTIARLVSQKVVGEPTVNSSDFSAPEPSA